MKEPICKNCDYSIQGYDEQYYCTNNDYYRVNPNAHCSQYLEREDKQDFSLAFYEAIFLLGIIIGVIQIINMLI